MRLVPCYCSPGARAGAEVGTYPQLLLLLWPPSHSRFTRVCSLISLPKPMRPAETSTHTVRHFEFRELLCLSQVPTQPQVGSTSAGYWPAQNSGAREILLQLYREHLVSKSSPWVGHSSKLTEVPGQSAHWPPHIRVRNPGPESTLISTIVSEF